MKTILIGLLLVSGSVFAQNYGAYPHYNNNHIQNYQIDPYEQAEIQRELQKEFLDEQYWNQKQLMDEQRWNMEIDRRIQREKRNSLFGD